MIVSAEQGNRGKLFDANGKQLDRVYWANLETGKCVQAKLDENGKPIIARTELAFVREECYHPAPLRFEDADG